MGASQRPRVEGLRLTTQSKPTRLSRWLHFAAIIILVATLAFAANRLGTWLISTVQLEITDLNKNYMYSAIVLSMVFYALLLAIPFVPGVEIGFGLIIMFGPQLVIPVYISTVIGINLGFVLGRVIPVKRLQSLLRFLYLDRAAELIERIAPLPHREKMQALAAAAPKRFVPFLLRHRYLAVAAAINIPGNAVIGGGGGIGMLAGLSRIFPWPFFLLAVALAVAPMPILILLLSLGANN